MLALVFVVCGLAWADQEPDVEGLANIMEGLHGSLTDVEFVYEGNVGHPDRQGTLDTPTTVFQGTFAYRNDECAHVDLFVNKIGEGERLLRKVAALSKGQLDEISFVPDGAVVSGRGAQPGGLPSLDRSESPLRIFQVPRLLQLLRDTGGVRTLGRLRYECLGWEEIEGRRCLKIRFVRGNAKEGSNKFTAYVYWLDMERGGNPIQYHDIANGVIWLFADRIELLRVSLPDGQPYWLPLRGRAGSYVDVDALLKTGGSKNLVGARYPTYLENFNIVMETIKVNQGLPDSRFSLDWSDSVKAVHAQNVRARLKERLNQPRRRTSEGVVDAVVNEAADQAQLLEASAPSREHWTATTVGMSLLGVFGTASLGLAAYLRWTQR
jgi:hypothetical protein